jgi:hypothetical protein
VKPTIPEIFPLVVEYTDRPKNNNGGSLHIILADQNISDSHVRWCEEYARENMDNDGVYLAEKLLLMSKTQRLKISRMWCNA